MPTLVKVDNRVRILLEGLDESVVTAIRTAFEHENPQHAKLVHLGLPAWAEPRIIKTHKNFRDKEGKWLTVPRGGMSRVRDVFRAAGVRMMVVDHRITGQKMEWPTPGDEMGLYGYQEEAMLACIEKENCLLRAPTGSGKTRVGFAFAKAIALPTLVVVWSAALFDQWHERAHTELGLRKRDIGSIRGKKVNLRPLTIAMSQTLAKGVSDEVKNYFGTLIFDEVQRAAANTMFKSIDPFPARYRLGISADHTRKDRKEFLIYDLFGAVAQDIKQKDLVKSGHVLDVEIRVVPVEFQADWYGHNDFRDTNFDDEPKNEKKELDFNRLLNEMTNDDERNEEIISIVREEVAAGEQVLVMTHRREHCLVLDSEFAAYAIKTGFLIGGTDYLVEFRKTLAGLKKKTLSVGVGTYGAIGQGLDLPGVAVAVATTPIGSNRQFFGQVRGRVCRIAKGKKTARLYYIWDQHVYPSHLENLIKWNTKVVVRNGNGWIDAREYLRKSA